MRDVPYNVDPSRLELTPRAGAALVRLKQAGFLLVGVSNQSGIGRGLFTAAELDTLWSALGDLFADEGVRLDAWYYCPHRPADRCACRKPLPGLLLRAASELRIELGESWMIGDILDDVEAGHRAGCRSILMDSGGETEWRVGPMRAADAVATDLLTACEFILNGRAW